MLLLGIKFENVYQLDICLNQLLSIIFIIYLFCIIQFITYDFAYSIYHKIFIYFVGALETTTAKSINTPIIFTDQPLIKESPETTKEQDKAIPTTTIIPTIVTKAIISITELFHNLTSTEISPYVTESTIHSKNHSTIVSEHSPSDFRTSTNPYTPEEPTTERTANTVHSPKILNETTIETTTVTEKPVNENTENDNIFKGTDLTDENIHSNASSTTSESTSEHETTVTYNPKPETTSITAAEHDTTSSSISEHQTTVTSVSGHEATLISISEHETTTSSLVTNVNDSIDLSEQPTSIPDNINSYPETTTNLSPHTEHVTTQQDLTTIGYHIKEETTEMYTFEDNTKLEINPEFDTTTEQTSASVPDTEVTTNHFFPNLITELTTTEVTGSTALDLPKNNSEVNEFNTTDITNVPHATNASDTIETTTITEDLQTTAMNSDEEIITGTMEFINVTEIPNEEFLNNNQTNFTSPDDILNDTSFKNPDAADSFVTTTIGPLTTSPHFNRSPEVRSFNEDEENETTTQNINLNSTHNFTNDFSPETDEQTNKNDTVLILDSITTSSPTTEKSTEITLLEITTEKPEIYETTTHFVNPENEPLMSTEKNLIETTVIPIFISEDTETTINMGETSAITTEISHANKSPNVMNGMLDTTTTMLGSETTTIASTGSDITTNLPVETETPNTVIRTGNSTEADLSTLENNTKINTPPTFTDTIENGTTYTSNDSETIEHLHHDKENTSTSSYNESTIPDILETTLPNTENNVHTIIVGNSTDENFFNSSTALNNTDEESLLSTTPEPMNISDELTTLEDVSTLDDSDLTSLETSNFSISNTEFPNSVTSTLSPDSNETLTLDTVPDYILPTPPYPNGSEIEVTTESIYGTETTFTFAGYDNETLFPFDMDSNFTNTTDMPFESSFLGINSTLFAGSNESLENGTYFGEFENFTTEGYDAANETTTNASTGIECREGKLICNLLNFYYLLLSIFINLNRR